VSPEKNLAGIEDKRVDQIVSSSEAAYHSFRSRNVYGAVTSLQILNDPESIGSGCDRPTMSKTSEP